MLDYYSGTKPSFRPLKFIYFYKQYTKISKKSKIQAKFTFIVMSGIMLQNYRLIR